MPLDHPDFSPEELSKDLNARLAGLHPADIVREVLKEPRLGRLAAVSSFGAEAVSLLHMISVTAPGLPVIFLDTGKHFPETLAYRATVTEALKLMDVRVVAPDRQEVFARDPDGILHVMDPDACCALRKTEPLEKALQGFDGWITGRKRFQGGARTALHMVELDAASGRIKVNPLANWSRAELQAYMTEHELPRHPLADASMPSLGCAPCTSAIKPGEDARAGRWRGTDKEECGIHFKNGQVVRKAALGTDEYLETIET